MYVRHVKEEVFDTYEVDGRQVTVNKADNLDVEDLVALAEGTIDTPDPAVTQAAKELAAAHGLDPTGLEGSGHRGRVTVADVEVALNG